MNYRDFISSNPGVLLGKPIFTGTRITVELVLRKLSEGMTSSELLEAYPQLVYEHILASLAYSADLIAQEELLAS